MADEDILDELDVTKVPGYVPIPANTPNWKRSMLEKKNQEKIDEYKLVWEKERDARRAEIQKKKAEEERRRLEEEKWAKLPEWKRKILQEKSRKEDQVRTSNKSNTPSAPTTTSKPTPPPPTSSKPQKTEPPVPTKTKIDPPITAPKTKVPVLPPGPSVQPKKAAVPAPAPAPTRSRDALPVSAAVAVVDDTQLEPYVPQPVLVSKIQAMPLKAPQTSKRVSIKRTIRVIKKSTGSI